MQHLYGLYDNDTQIAMVVHDESGVIVNTIVVRELTDVSYDGHTLHPHPMHVSRDGSYGRYHPIMLGKHRFIDGRVIDEDGHEVGPDPHTRAVVEHIDRGGSWGSFKQLQREEAGRRPEQGRPSEVDSE